MEEFKKFVRRHPELRNAVREKKATWQSLYEEWFLYGEADSQWDQYKEAAARNEANGKAKSSSDAKTTTEKSSGTMGTAEMMAQAIQYIQKMDMNKVQQTMGTVQQFIQIFQTMQGGNGKAAAGKAPQGTKQSYPGLFSKFDD